MMHIHHLDGCAPVPLAHYLKALGILRLVAEQADPQARAWWEGERFRLATSLSARALDLFFLQRYEPTPLVSPWNKGSGFYSVHDRGLSPLESSISPRFERFRIGIVASRERLQTISEADALVRSIKAEAKVPGLTKAQKDAIRSSPAYKARLAEANQAFARGKAELVPTLRKAWRGPHGEWVEAAIVLGPEGEPSFPALLGTGGNDGRLDFTNNFMQRLTELFDAKSATGQPRPEAGKWFRAALWGEPAPGYLRGPAVGQYLPGTAGGANNANGPEADSLLNPADFVLMMEGTILFTAHVARRLGTRSGARVAAPFSVASHAAAYPSAAGEDEGPRGEQWMPLWSQPMTLVELKRLLAEGRAQISNRTAETPLDLARAIGRLGVARGVASFQRFGYIERNGQSNLAVPLGRFIVPTRSSSKLECLGDLDAWLGRLHRLAREKEAPARLSSSQRRLAETLFTVCQHPDEPTRWQHVLIALGEVEKAQKLGAGFAAGPAPPLRPQWVLAADDGGHELRLAVALALQQGGYEGEDAGWWNTTRRHWLPLDRSRPRRFATTGTGHQRRLHVGPEVVMDGRRGVDDAIAFVERRLTESSQTGAGPVPLVPGWRATAATEDLSELLAGEIDLDRTVALARALMALDWRAWRAQPIKLPRMGRDRCPDDAWMAIRLALLPWPLEDERGGEIHIGTDPAILRRLAVGDAETAVSLAIRRLSAAGVRTAIRTATAPPETARLWAAALAFPISRGTATGFLRRLDPTAIEKEATA